MFGSHSTLLVVVEDFPGSENASILNYAWIGSGFDEHEMHLQESLICNSNSCPYPGPYDDWNWCYEDEILGPKCSTGGFSQERLDNWTKFGHKVLYCMSLRLGEEYCEINYSYTIMLSKLSFSMHSL